MFCAQFITLYAQDQIKTPLKCLAPVTHVACCFRTVCVDLSVRLVATWCCHDPFNLTHVGPDTKSLFCKKEICERDSTCPSDKYLLDWNPMKVVDSFHSLFVVTSLNYALGLGTIPLEPSWRTAMHTVHNGAWTCEVLFSHLLFLVLFIQTNRLPSLSR